MKARLCCTIVASLLSAWSAPAVAEQTVSSDELRPVPFTRVQLEDDFWRPRLETNRRTTIRYCFEKCGDRIDNFSKAGGLMEGPHIGHRYDDSDVYKVIEGAAYSLAAHPDPELESFLDDLIEKIAAAQEDDGYLYTARTIDPAHPAKGAGAERWSYVAQSHELYSVGHLYEAAVAYHQATGKRNLLDVAIKSADLIDREFGPGKRQDPPGHEEIEIGLVKLARETGEQRYLDLARFFLDIRGRADTHKLYGQYCQDHLPVTQQSAPVGHAVRDMYLVCGMADVARAAGDDAYLPALGRIWTNMVSTKLYLTGGVGARHDGEAFGDDYELPNESAYNETCAAIGNAMWNQRMALLYRDATYADVLERVIYNGFLSGVSLSGDRFFYPNPLASGGTYHRSEWFSCSCCPVNVVRFVPSIPGYIYAHDEDGIFVNLYVAGEARIDLPGNTVTLRQETEYPWDGAVRIVVEPEQEGAFELNLRIPGWARGAPVPSDLYSYVGETDASKPVATLAINGRPVPLPALERGYARLARTWKRGDEVALTFDMPVRLVRASDAVEADRDRLAIERGPIVYCLEAVDNGGYVRDLWMTEDATFTTQRRPDLLGGVTTIQFEGRRARRDGVDEAGGGKGGQEGGRSEPATLTAIPYAVWDNRAAGEMAVWLPTAESLAEPIPPATLASSSRVTASYCCEGDSVLAVNDQREPSASNDQAIGRFTWWPHEGTAEWIQYDFAEPHTISGLDVYWFDDTGSGGCRVPASWRILTRAGNDPSAPWTPVESAAAPGVERDAYNRVEFKPVTAAAVRLEVKLQDGYSGGILEWRLRK